MPVADFRFPQDEDADAVEEVATGSADKTGWVASYVDYFYMSLTNSMAFSPTDTMPRTTRAKALMALESASGFILLGLVIARAVSLLKKRAVLPGGRASPGKTLTRVVGITRRLRPAERVCTPMRQRICSR